MARFAIPLSIAAVAGLAACTTYDANYPNRPVSSASGTVTAPASGTTVTSTRSTVAGNPVVYTAPTANATGAILTPASSPTFKAGTGIVEAVQLVHIMPASGTASSSAGSTMPQSVAYRLTVKMDGDGSLQAIDQDSSSFRAGDRVRLSADGQVMPQ
jgi:outer membrane lipoprotein SlyB